MTDSESYTSRREKGIKLAREGRSIEAFQTFREIIIENPTDSIAWVWLALTSNNYAESLAFLARASAIDSALPHIKDAQRILAVTRGAPPAVQIQTELLPQSVMQIESQSLILVVDDISSSKEHTLNRLRKEGYSLLIVPEVKAAVKKLNNLWASKGKVASLILCDVFLPDFDGLELFLAARTNPFYHSVPFVFMGCAYLPPALYNDAILCPWDVNEMVTIVSKWLNFGRQP